MNKIDLSKGFVDISDPCYSKDTWCRTNNIKVKPGKYNCYMILSDENEWGMRVKESYIIHEDYKESDVFPICDHIAVIGVDAGLAGYMPSEIETLNKSGDVWSDFCYSIGRENEILYNNCYITSSGYGDGSYPVYGAKEKGKEEYIALRILFIDVDSNENEDDYE